MRGIFLLGALAAALVPMGLQNAPGRRFSVASLKGTCIWQEVKLPTTSGDAQNLGPATILASIRFDGYGAMTMDYDVNLNGTYTSTNGVAGSYSVDSTGHGTFAFTSPASGIVRTYDFRVSPNGQTIYTIAQSDGGLSVTQRVSTGSCRFQD
ncbi:MAG TPA: hypothetical protein VNJ12_13325 [Candidatus Dormibacteraeota bacterium]|nr:hypothetical protein [Candidatus Dormibacteraeota bacterium]